MVISTVKLLPFVTADLRPLCSSSTNHNAFGFFSSPFSSLSFASLQQNRIQVVVANVGGKFPSFNSVRACSASMSSSLGEVETSPVSFLDRKESGLLHFVKYHGLGNDFILVDNRDSVVPKISSEQAAKLCDRNFGIGADGVIFALPGINGTDYTMRIFNSDASEPEMCGNGVRCLARFISELEKVQGKQSYTILTGAGLIVPEIQEDGQVRVDMGEPILKASDVPTKLQPNKDQLVVKAKLEVDGISWIVTCVSMGNPHCITFSKDFGEVWSLYRDLK